MPANRYYVAKPLLANQEVVIDDKECLHLVRVMRAQVNDPIELVNGKGILATAHITSIEKRCAKAIVERVKTREPTSPSITLAIPFAQSSKLDLIIEKGCELGAASFWIYPAENSEKKALSINQQHRLTHLLISAMKQCGRLDLPTLELKPPLKEWGPFKGTSLFGDTRDTAKSISKKDSTIPILFITGPEKGFTPKEITTLEQTLHAQGVRLHENILRMETAPLVALIQGAPLGNQENLTSP